MTAADPTADELPGFSQPVQALTPFLPMDRRQALAAGRTLPDRTTGAALFADVSGFTPLTELLTAELGRKRGAEELLRRLNPIYEALIQQLHAFGGSVISFAGDAVVCWFDDAAGPAGPRAVAAGLAMQAVMRQHAVARTPAGMAVDVAITVAIAVGPVRRFLVGAPAVRQLDVLAGDTLLRMAAAEVEAEPGDVVVSAEVIPTLTAAAPTYTWRAAGACAQAFAVVTALNRPVAPTPWPEPALTALTPAQLRAWINPTVFDRLQAGGRFLGDLRPVTPMFVKFAGIDFDGDDEAGAKLDSYVRWVQTVLARYEGDLLQIVVGDKGSSLYCAFGALLAHENDAARACLSAVALQTPPAALDFVAPIQVGIHQGQVWTGACGSSQRHDFAAMGAAVNTAARLMAAAAPAEILVSRLVAELSQSQVVVALREPLSLRGLAAPLPVAVVTAVAAAVGTAVGTGATAPASSLGSALPPLVGREDELGALLLTLDQVRKGAGRVVLVEAEAGQGKSHLVAAWTAAAQRRGWPRYLGESQSIEQHMPYRAWRDLLGSFLDLTGDPEPALQLARLEQFVGQLAPAMRLHIPLLNDIFDLNLPETTFSAGLTAHGRQQALQTLILSLFRAAGRETPLLLVLEDVHWLDAASWTLTRQIVRGLRLTATPFLLILVSRPVREPAPALAWLLAQPFTGRLALPPLPETAIDQIVSRQLQVPPVEVPAALAAFIHERAEGNPYFATELLLNLQTRGVVTVDWDAAADRPVCRLAPHFATVAASLPVSLQGVILARMDRLSPLQQQVLKLAAIIGRGFAYQPLRHLFRPVDEQAETALGVALAALAERAFLVVEAREPERRYLFKHVLIREVAYDTLLYEQRRPLHRLVAAWYESAYAGPLAESPYLGLLVHHYREAEAPAEERLAAYLAGRQAAARYANEDALSYLDRALALTAPTDTVTLYDVLCGREEVFDRLGRREAQAVALRRLAAVIGDMADPERQVTYLLRQTRYAEAISDYPQAVRWVAEAVAQASAAGLDGLLAAAYYQWAVIIDRGQLPAGELRTYAEHALILAEATGQMRIVADVYLLFASYYRQRDTAEAQVWYEKALALAEQLGALRLMGRIYMGLGVMTRYQWAYAVAEGHLEKAVTICAEVGDLRWQSVAQANMGIVLRQRGDYAGCQRQLEAAQRLFADVADWHGWILCGVDLADIYLILGQVDAAFALWAHCRQRLEDIGVPQTEANLLRRLGLGHLRLGQVAEAAACLADALAVQQGLTTTVPVDLAAAHCQLALAQADAAELGFWLDVVCEHLRANPAAVGGQDPLGTLWSAYEGAHWLGRSEAPELLARARRELDMHLANLADEAQRALLRTQVPAAAKILQTLSLETPSLKAPSLKAPSATENETEDDEDQEDPEENPGNPGRGAGDPAKAKDTGQ